MANKKSKDRLESGLVVLAIKFEKDMAELETVYGVGQEKQKETSLAMETFNLFESRGLVV